MHEAAIAQSVIEIAEGVARQRGSANVRKIKLRVGEFRNLFAIRAVWLTPL